ncbi:MAG: cysteine--tRNA ligase [Pseudomonadota bacterium]
MTEITLTNSMTRRKERLTPLDPANVRMYVCGPTVYDRAHVGNARAAVVFDQLFRVLRQVYGAEHVTYARNFTDVDDKINVRAAEIAASGDERVLVDIVRSLTDETIGWYHEDMGALPDIAGSLGCLRPTHEPRATAFIAQMIAMIEALIEKGLAYAAEDHVLFEVAKYAEYGALSRRSLDEMVAGARVEVAPYKRDPVDFVLWKPSTPEQPGWESPWGRGRPGWHIECSAMAEDLLGRTFDIHGGGNDLTFPHHENEIAQSCGLHGQGSFAQIWMHNGFLNVEGEKMSKSLGNFFTVKDMRDQGVPGEVMRLLLLSTHYRKPMDWRADKVAELRGVLSRWRAGLDGVAPTAPDGEVIAALTDDLNTPLAIARLHELWKLGTDEALGAIAASLDLLGIDPAMPGLARAEDRSGLDRDVIADLVRHWQALRAEKDYAAADSVRERSAKLGLNLSLWQAGEGAEKAVDPALFDAAAVRALADDLGAS